MLTRADHVIGLAATSQPGTLDPRIFQVCTLHAPTATLDPEHGGEGNYFFADILYRARSVSA